MKKLYFITLIQFLSFNSILSNNLSRERKCFLYLQLYIHGYMLDNDKMKPTLFEEEQTKTRIVDTVLVKFHEKNRPYKSILSIKTILDTNGIAKCRTDNLYGDYYISVKTRNSLETWSSCTIRIKGNTIKYNFSKSRKQAFGDNLFEIKPGLCALYSGDINQDRKIDSTDLLLLEKSISKNERGYINTDINGDGNADLLDLYFLTKYLNEYKKKSISRNNLNIKMQRPN